MRDVVLRSSIDLDASPEELWPLLTDTERMNRSLGMGEVRFRPIEEFPDRDAAESPARYLAETRLAGFRMTYHEEPFEFVAPHTYSVRRVMHGGPLQQLTMRVTLEPLDKGTKSRATFNLEVVVRSVIFTPLVHFAGRPLIDKMIEDAKDAVLRAHGERPAAMPRPLIDPGHLGRALSELEGESVDPALVAKLAFLVTQGHDAEVVAIRPFELARQWSVDPRDMLKTMLLGVKSGLFELRWALICPSCRTFTDRVASLDEIPENGHCQLCDIGFELDMDQAVEATFMVHPGVRRVNETTFCIGGPARTPHVLQQTSIAPRGVTTLTAPEAEGRYRIFARGGGTLRLTLDPAALQEAAAEAQSDGATFSPAELTIAPRGTITVTNATSEARHVKLERFEYASNAATAAVLSTMDDFRRIFSADLLKRGTPLKVARVAMFFSDLTGSTALYSKVGDAVAFRIVDDHFDILRAVIAQHDGVLVKTMGDAVMASFHDTRSCALACIDALRGFETFRAASEHGDQIGLKVGMYSGPCYVVTANGVLDYFGQTVNVTSRVQHLAASGEIVMTPKDFALLDAATRSGLVVLESFQAVVKGVDTPLDLLRVRLASDPLVMEQSEPSIRAMPSRPTPRQPAPEK